VEQKLLAFIFIKSTDGLGCNTTGKALASIPEVQEVHHIAGEEDYLLKVVAASPTDYERFVLGRLLKVPAIEKVKTTFVLSSSKVDTRIPVEPEG